MMDRQIVIDKTIHYLKLLPEEKAMEVLDYTEFLYKKIEEVNLTQEIVRLSTESKSFDFLENEEDIYTKEDIKEQY